MNQKIADAVSSFVVRMLDNKHTSAAGVIWIACKLGAIWLPRWKDQFEATEAVAVGYGLFMAGDSKPQIQKPQ